jgi:pilus assembly protein CpaF
MVTMFGRRSEGGLDARIAELSARRAKVDGPNGLANAPLPEKMVAPVPVVEQESPIEERLAIAREELSARLGAEIRPERRALLSRGDLAKIVDAAVQAYFVRHAIDANPLARRDLVTDIMQTLLTPGGADGANRRNPHKAAIEAAKAQIQPLVLEHMDVAAAAEMPRPAFEAQLTGWVKELLAETKIQLNFTEQRELVESLIADMLGLGPLEPLIADDTVSDIMVNGPKQVYVERRGKLELTDVVFRDDQHLMNICTKIVTRIGRRIDESRPLVDARLPDGSRVNIIIPPLAIDGASI